MPKNKFNLRSLGVTLGVGASCAALALAPITTNLLTNSKIAHASGGYSCEEPMPESWNTIQISKENYIDAVNSAKTIAGVQMFNMLTAATTKVADARANNLSNLKKEAEASGYYDSITTESDIAKIKQSAGYSDNAALKSAVEKAENALIVIANEYKAAVLAANPSIDLSGATDIDQIYNMTNATLEEQYGDDFKYYEALGLLTYIGNDSSDAEGRKNLFYEVVCMAKNLKPDFEVVYATSTNPFDGSVGTPSTGGGDVIPPMTGGDSSVIPPMTGDDPLWTIIESLYKDVKVSGINININYTLNVNLIPVNLLKLTGDNFKSSLNQAFYDIFIQNAYGDIVQNVGDVTVSIKLPSNMSAKSVFIVYYVPMASNGEYLTGQAQAIKDVKVSADGWLTFQTNHFSTYGIVEYPKSKAPNTGVAPQDDGLAAADGVKAFASIVATLAVAGVGVVAHRQILRRKEEK